MTVGQLAVVVDGRRWLFPPGVPVVIGRGLDCEVVLTDPRVSRRHLRIEPGGGGWVARDLASANGTFRRGERLVRHQVGTGLAVRLGHPGDGPLVELAVSGAAARDRHPLADVTTLGRAADNNVVLTDLLVSRRHASLTRRGDVHEVRDLGSSNSTFVNGVPIRRATLVEGDLLTIGRTRFVHHGTHLRRLPEAVEADLVVEDLSYALPGGRTLTNLVSFQLSGPCLVAMLGPSGAGKSTLLRLLAGDLPPTAGRVWYEAVDVHAHRAELRSRIGMVPQHTIAHERLTAREALRYAARLRLSRDVAPAEQARLTDQVLGELGLAEHSGTRIDRLSGGQQRRLSIGFELLTRTSLLLLDEPTSGLDPGLADEVMRQLRALADDGRQVLVTTHDVAHLGLCDTLLVLGAGGQLAYRGPPDGVASHFGTDEWPEVFRQLAATTAAGPAGAAGASRTRPSARPAPEVRPAWSLVRRQAGVVASRQLRLLATDPPYLGFLAALPLALAALALAVPGADGLGPPSGAPDGQVMRLLVVLVVGATFMGMAVPVRDLVGERRSYRYERRAGLQPEAYLLAKLGVFAGVVWLQAGVLVAVVRLVRPGPAGSVLLGSGTLEIAMAVAVTAATCAAVGLLISATVATVEQTMPPLVVTVMAQLVLCGGLVPVTGRPGLEQLSWLMPARWGYAATANTVDLRSIVPDAPDDLLWAHQPPAWAGAMAGLLVLGAGCAATTLRRLRRP